MLRYRYVKVDQPDAAGVRVYRIGRAFSKNELITTAAPRSLARFIKKCKHARMQFDCVNNVAQVVYWR